MLRVEDRECRTADSHASHGERSYRTLLESIDQGYCVLEMLFDVDGRPVDYRFHEVNPAFETLTGLRSAVGKRMLELYPQHEPVWFETFGRVAQTGQAERFECQASHTGDRWFDLYAFPIGAAAEHRLGVLFADVTARRRAADELYRSQQALRVVIDTIPQRVFWKDENSVYLGCNRAFAEEMGYQSPDEVVGKTDYQASWAKIAEPYRADDRRVFESREPLLDYDEAHRTPADSTRWVRTNKVPLFTPDGRIAGVLGTYEDITERKLAEHALRESEARFRTLVDALPDAVLIFRNRRVEFCNPAGLRLFATTDPAHLIGRSPFELHPAEFHPVLAQRIAEFTATGTFGELEVDVARADGGRTPVQVTALPISVDGTRATLVVLRDLTERKRVERQLRHQEMMLREAAELAHVGGWGFDPITLEGDWTAETARIHGVDPSTDPGVQDGLARFEPEGREKLEKALRAAIADGTPYDLELWFTAATGQRKRVRAICRPVVEGGRVVRVRGSLQDVTERYELEMQLRQSQKMDAFGQLAGGIAHDFNNLLQVINGYADLLLDRLPPDDTAGMVGEIRRAGERSAALTRQLLAFARRQMTVPRVLDLGATATETVGMLRRLIGEDIRLETDMQAGVWPVEIDPGQLEQVLVNLTVNARDAMPSGGTLTVGTRNELVQEVPGRSDVRPGPHAVLFVTDTGCGMTGEVLGRIFEPFYTTKGVGQGTGLGLATVFGIVQQAGGHVRVQSRVGGGSTFEVYLPRAVKFTPESPPPPATAPALPPGAETTLVIEDEAEVRGLIKMVLTRCGYTVLEACDAAAAERTAAAHTGPIHLIVSDVVMPGEGGRAAAAKVRALHPDARLLFVSGHTDDAVVRHGISAAEVPFLQKPFTPAALACAVREVLDSRVRTAGEDPSSSASKSGFRLSLPPQLGLAASVATLP